MKPKLNLQRQAQSYSKFKIKYIKELENIKQTI
jgi:hypothetical protein